MADDHQERALILAIDPGRRPGYVLLDERQPIQRRHIPGRPKLPLVVGVALSFDAILQLLTPALVPSQVICEGQHGVLNRKRKRAILTLSVEAGWQLHRACAVFAATPHIVHPEAISRKDLPGWRDILRCTGVTKDVVQARVEKSLLTHEAALFACASASRLGDCLDATAIGWGGVDFPEWKEPP